jgi:parallel beta-helix repeat protein
VERAIARKCELTDPIASIESLFACPGAVTVADLQACVVCENQRAATTLIGQQSGEQFAALVLPGGSLQAAVDAAAPGDKILILPGMYAEEVVVQTDGLQLVGCGAATNDRPRLVPPGGVGPHPNGIFAANVDGLVFQGLEVFDWDENGIFVTGATGVTFRDVVGDGNANSVYAIYPVQSRDVLIEGCVARRIADAGIYVGQDENIVVRYNLAEDNVAGIEIENSAFAQVYGNLARHNTGGMLVFKLPGPPLQLSNDHEVFDNVSIDNDTPNFGDPNSAVGAIPDGTGLLVLSNDSSDFHHNILQGNGTFGLAVVDQRTVNLLSPGSFNPESPDQRAEGNIFRDNLITGNAFNPDATPPNDVPPEVATNLIYLLGEGAPNCFVGNVVADGPDPIGLDASVCP